MQRVWLACRHACRSRNAAPRGCAHCNATGDAAVLVVLRVSGGQLPPPRTVAVGFQSAVSAVASLLVPGERFELPTNGLQNRCSTTELTRQINDLRSGSSSIV